MQSAMPTPHLFERTLLGMCAVIRAAKSALRQVLFEPAANFLAEALFFTSVVQVHIAIIRRRFYRVLYQRRFRVLKNNRCYQCTQA